MILLARLKLVAASNSFSNPTSSTGCLTLASCVEELVMGEADTSLSGVECAARAWVSLGNVEDQFGRDTRLTDASQKAD